MNNGKICVSVCAETADELIKQIKRAESLADVIEIRFDCLKENEFNILNLDESEKVFTKVLANKSFKDSIILTFRPKEQGGKRELSLKKREDFWNSGYDAYGGDFEEDVVENSFNWLYEPVICSYHDFNAIPENLQSIYKRLRATKVDIVKIAVQADDVTDSIAVWKLLEQSKQENKRITDSLAVWNLLEHARQRITEIIPIAMGAAGKWTRILGLAHGAFLTYAALDTGKETAPGQVSAKDLIEVYRAKELNEQTDVYGIIGNPVSHSMSPYIHNASFKSQNLNAVFVPFEVKNLDEFVKRFVDEKTREVELNFRGFSVTIPHKQAIIKFLDSIDETAEAVGAVNTVKILDGKLYGFNTDAPGFIEPLQNSYGDLRGAKVAVLGNGGAARACIYALKKEAAEVVIFARDLKKAEALASEFEAELREIPKTENRKPKTDFRDFDILVNSTPLGMRGKFENETPVFAEQMENLKLVYDLVYNPLETRLIKEARKANVPTIGGLAMFIAQGARQFKIWTGKDAPLNEMSQIAIGRLQN